MSFKVFLFLAAGALFAIAAWPVFVHARIAAQAEPAWTAAPVIADYLNRDATIAFYERSAHRAPGDQIIARMLAAQYLTRFRERADIGDALRAAAFARRSLADAPVGNGAADAALSSALLALHRFKDARRYALAAFRVQPWNSASRSAVATLDMELGDYNGARRLLATPPAVDPDADVSWQTARARYDELTGNLQRSRYRIERAGRVVDDVIDNSAEARAWFHVRAAELALESGDYAGAVTGAREALAIYPSYARAYGMLARTCWSRRQWPQALTAAARAADIVPLPEYLGYQADAQRGLGNIQAARQTEDLIRAIERIGNAQRINDRIIASYYLDHDMNLVDALRIARRDIAARDDVFSEDTLAWALAKNGRWTQARVHALRATRLGTQNSLLQYHAAVIALHIGRPDEAHRRFEMALALSPQFHPAYARVARRLLHVTAAAGPAHTKRARQALERDRRDRG